MIIDDDTLILHYYNDGLLPDESRRIDAALRDDPALARRYRELTDALAGLRVDGDNVEPPPAALHRWQTGLARAARVEASASPRRRWPLWIGGAVAAATVLAVGLSIAPSDPSVDATPLVLIPPATHSAPAAESSARLQRGVRSHLRDADARLDELAMMNAPERALAIADILERNRAYQRAANDQNADQLARNLRAFEPALLTLADADTDLPTFLAQREKLSFELGVIRARLAHAVPA